MAVGTDPHDRPLEWVLENKRACLLLHSTVSQVGEPAQLGWVVGDGDVSEGAIVQLLMSAKDRKCRRFRRFDHCAYFIYIVRPPH
ncbi:hypothetical protein [Hoyosella subflava]|uniref:hypothetical protein n=1 Tax=Hoyosella subflava TaxID=639313 RepID=UPI0002E8065A|nr:hypothetical protein [Hoyosella subflava]